MKTIHICQRCGKDEWLPQTNKTKWLCKKCRR